MEFFIIIYHSIYVYFLTALHSVNSTVSVLWPQKSQNAWTCSIFMHSFLTDCFLKTDHLNILLTMHTSGTFHWVRYSSWYDGVSEQQEYAMGRRPPGCSHVPQAEDPLVQAGCSPTAPEQGWWWRWQPAAPGESRERVRARESKQE